MEKTAVCPLRVRGAQREDSAAALPSWAITLQAVPTTEDGAAEGAGLELLEDPAPGLDRRFHHPIASGPSAMASAAVKPISANAT